MTELQPGQEDRADERERDAEWARHDKDRDRVANERAYWRAVAYIPNPGPVEPLTELQAFHAEQTDPPPGPYPDPPLGPYPDPVIKERPSEEAVYGRATIDRTAEPTYAGSDFGAVPDGGRDYDEPNIDAVVDVGTGDGAPALGIASGTTDDRAAAAAGSTNVSGSATANTTSTANRTAPL